MADKLGAFFKQPHKHQPKTELQVKPDISYPDPAPNIPHPGKQPVPDLSTWGPPHPFEPPPVLSKPGSVPFEPAPTLSVPATIPFEPAPPLSIPANIPFEPAPPPSSPARIAFEPPPPLRTPDKIPFENPPQLSQPTQIPFEPVPTLSVPVDPAFQNPPQLSSTGTIAFQPAPPFPEPPLPPPVIPPTLSKPRPVNDVGGSSFIEFGNLKDVWNKAATQQVAYFDREVKKTLLNLAQRALPTPGKIDPDLLPSTQATKILNVANNKIQELENKYGYNQLTNVGAKVNNFIGGAIGVNSAPDGAVENNTNYTSLQNINNDFRKNPDRRLSDLFQPGKNQLKGMYTENIKNDQKYYRLEQGSKVTYRSAFDEKDGLLHRDVSVNVVAKDSYFPFYLADLRPDSNKKYRTVFFQPLNLEISENFSPSWSVQNYIGRVDPVATYQNTTRTINVSFKMVAFHPADLEIIYGKLKWLTSMVYPEYSPNMRYKSGPVVKLRIGNVINASNLNVPLSTDRPGVPGFITSLDYTYENTWELEDDWQVPRGVDVSFGFTVLHEMPVGILDGAFGTIGQLDDTGVYTTPQSLMGKSTESDSRITVKAREYVESRGFRQVGPEDVSTDEEGI